MACEECKALRRRIDQLTRNLEIAQKARRVISDFNGQLTIDIEVLQLERDNIREAVKELMKLVGG